MPKLKLAVYWASSCGGCDIAIVELGEHLLELATLADIVFWPCAMDFKYEDVEAMPDGSIDLVLLNGAIRTETDAEIATLLRRKGRTLVAFGSCAVEGCVPGLGNTKGTEYLLQRSYGDPSTAETASGSPIAAYHAVPEGGLTLPTLFSRLRPVDELVTVDYRIPGCPPKHDQIWNALNAVLEGNLPAPGGLLGVDTRAVCDQCPRERTGKVRVDRFYRVHEIVPDPNRCFLEQGLICAGPVTHAGCGALCIGANMPCRGCYGPAEGVTDQGAALLDAVVAGLAGESEEEIQRVLGTLVDPVGTFYRFSFAHSLMQRLQESQARADTDSQTTRQEAAQ